MQNRKTTLNSMTRLKIGLVGAFFLVVSGWAETAPVYINYGTITNTPQIDAERFINYGYFGVSVLDDAYQFSNTRYFTNYGEMRGFPGFNFETIDNQGIRSAAEVFVNAAGALIFGGSSMGEGIAIFSPPLIRIHAKKIINRGVLTTSHDGLIQIIGEDVDLSRSGIGVDPILMGSGWQIGNQYWPDEGIHDQYWGIGTLSPRMATSALVTSYAGTLSATAPPHCTTNVMLNTICTPISFTLSDPYSFVYTNEVNPTNWIIQVVLVSLQDTNIYPQVNFYPSSNPSNAFNTVTLQLAVNITNVVDAGQDLITIYLIDRLASETNRTVATNMITGGMPYRAGSYELTRNMPMEFAMGFPTNAVFRTNLSELIYNTGGVTTTNIITNVVNNTTNVFTNIVTSLGYQYDVVTNIYAALGAEITNVVRAVPNVPGASDTNRSGRVEIFAKNLNLERTRLRGEGALVIHADNLISTRDAAIDAPYLFYQIGTTNENLRLQSLVIPQVQRFAGQIMAWSAVWTNRLNLEVNTLTNAPVVTNIDDGQGGTITVTNYVPTNVITTNVINVGIHVMFVDASSLRSRAPSFITGLRTMCTNLFVTDTTRIKQSLYVDSKTLTIDRGAALILGEYSSVGIPTGATEWNASVAPHLLSLTNYGILGVRDEIICGLDRGVPYDSFVNYGTNVASAIRILTKHFENSGWLGCGSFMESLDGQIQVVPTLGKIEIQADDIKLDHSVLQTLSDIELTAQQLKLRRSTNLAGRAVILNVTDILTDNGGPAENLIEASQGIHIPVKPQQGDLLGTRILLHAAPFQLVESEWPGEDRGPRVEGFTNNLAVGILELDPQQQSELVLRGTGEKNAMYVDRLVLGPIAAAHLTETIHLDPSLKIYFADANVPPEILTNAFPGQMIYVNYAGPNSSIPVVLHNGEVLMVNRLFRNNPAIDSDADGIGNAYDLHPFDGVRIRKIEVTPNGTVRLSWMAAANTTYQIEATSSLIHPEWSVVQEVRHDASQAEEIQTEIPLSTNVQERYFRVSYEPGK